MGMLVNYYLFILNYFLFHCLILFFCWLLCYLIFIFILLSFVHRFVTVYKKPLINQLYLLTLLRTSFSQTMSTTQPNEIRLFNY